MAIKLIRLRMTENNYENLPMILRIIRVGEFNEDSDFFDYLKNKMEGKNFDDIRSTLQKLDIIQGKELTSFGKYLYWNRDDGEKIKRLIAKKILIEKNGWAICHAISMVPGFDREKIWYLYKELYDEDIQEVYTDISKFKNILKWLGIVKHNDEFDDSKFKEYIGTSIKEVDEILNSLDIDSRLSFVALTKLDNKEEHAPVVVRNIVELLFNRKLSTHKMENYRDKLAKMGLIVEKRVHRRGKPNKWKLTNKGKKINKKILQGMFLANNTLSTVEIFNKTFDELITDMDKSSSHVKGEALEIFTAKLCWILGIRNIIIRLREEIEVDVVGEINFPLYNKVLVQCKNQKNKVGPPIIAKEIGTASVEKFNTIIIVSNSGFTDGVREYINKSMIATGINILLFDRNDLEKIANSKSTNEEISNVYSVFKKETNYVAKIRNSNNNEMSKIQLDMFLINVIKQYSLSDSDYKVAKIKIDESGLEFPDLNEEEFKELFKEKYKSYSRMRELLN
jgi:predicted transcriptional regulator